jgi:hypothetical protein
VEVEAARNVTAGGCTPGEKGNCEWVARNYFGKGCTIFLVEDLAMRMITMRFITLLLMALAVYGCGNKRTVDRESEASGIELVKKIGGQAFQDSDPVPTVYSVNFKNSTARDEDMKILRHFPNLRNLEVNFSNIGKGAQYLDACPDLEEINWCSDEFILNLPELKKLKTVNAFGLSDTGIAALKRFPSLEWLSTQNNKAFTDAGLEHLAQLPRLKNLIISNSSVTQAGVDKLRNARPAVHIELK